MWEYSETVKDHYTNPRNIGMMEDANLIGYAGGMGCGDALTLFLKISEDEIVEKASFLVFGCGPAVASGSILTEMIIGKHLEELPKITNKDIVKALDGLPPEKVHCSIMCEDVIAYALSEYKK